MELELSQLDLRYAELRRRNSRRERQLLASLGEHGQRNPVVVVRADTDGRYILVDGYKRVRAIKRLAIDTVRAMVWDIAPCEALIVERLMRGTEPDSAIEQGWLLRTLRIEFGLSQEELARRFDRSKSWISRRIALIEGLPPEVGERVRTGAVPPHAAMKYLVPLARANRADCIRMVTAISGSVSSRQVAALYGGYKAAGKDGRERLCADPDLYLRAVEAVRQGADEGDVPPGYALLRDFDALAGIARRLKRLLREGHQKVLAVTQQEELDRAARQARQDTERLFTQYDQNNHEVCNARPEHAECDSQAGQ